MSACLVINPTPDNSRSPTSVLLVFVIDTGVHSAEMLLYTGAIICLIYVHASASESSNIVPCMFYHIVENSLFKATTRA